MTLIRISAEDYWVPTVFGTAAQPLLSIARQHEEDICSDAVLVLIAEQREAAQLEALR